MAFIAPSRGVQVVRRRTETALASFPSRSFYVDATLGNNGNSGRSPADAWQTVGKVNGETFLPGDRILFKRGENFSPADNDLRPPSSGVAGRPITFSTYGDGARPVFDGGGTRQALFNSNVSYVTFESLRFQRAANIDNVCCNLSGTGSNIIFRDCDIYGGKQGVFSPPTYSSTSVLNSTVDTSTDDGVVIQGPGGRVIGCTVINSGTTTNDRAGIKMNSATAVGGIIRWNTVRDCNGTDLCPGISSDIATDTIIEFNEVYNCSEGIFSYRSPRVRIAYNIVRDLYDTGDAFEGRGIYLGPNSDTTLCGVYNNVVYNLNVGMFIYGALSCDIRNNIISECGTRLASIYNGNEASHTLDNNLYFETGNNYWYWVDTTYTDDWAGFQTASSKEASGLNTDPLMVNPGLSDFHLQAGSPCRDAGADVGLSRDYDNVPVPQETNPAVGAFEPNL